MKIVLIFLLLSVGAHADENCDPFPILPAPIRDFAYENLAVTDEFFQNLVSFDVKYAGKGNILVLTNDQGEIEAIRLNYSHEGVTQKDTLDREKLAGGEKISLPGRPGVQEDPPLEFYPIIPPGLNFKTGGTFKIDIITNQNPRRTTEYTLKLIKSGPEWMIEQNNRRISSMTLHPSVSFFSWKGAFDKIEFR